MTTKQTIHEEFDEKFYFSLDKRLAIKEVKDFYDTKIQELLNEILPKKWDVGLDQSYKRGFNEALEQIKENIKQMGF